MGKRYTPPRQETWIEHEIPRQQVEREFDPAVSLAGALAFLDEQMRRPRSSFDRIYHPPRELHGGQPRGGGAAGYTPEHRRAQRAKNRDARRARKRSSR